MELLLETTDYGHNQRLTVNFRGRRHVLDVYAGLSAESLARRFRILADELEYGPSDDAPGPVGTG